VKEINIWLVEDSLPDVALVELALTEHHIPYRLRIIEDGADALALIQCLGTVCGSRRPDLVILDINVPKIHGLKLLAEFRRIPECRQTPVVVISAAVSPIEQSRLAALQADRFFPKCPDLDSFMKLGEVVRELFE
jgi:CheY-like chemotaxis protein